MNGVIRIFLECFKCLNYIFSLLNYVWGFIIVKLVIVIKM